MQEKEQIRISVIMGIYNCAETLPAAIESIVNQTISNWELIMCDDGSKDTTYDVALENVKKYPDKIKLLKNTRNRGLNYTLNKCLKKAKGEFVARMDGDDLCSPERFEKELEAFKEHPEIAIVSTAMEYFDEKGKWGYIKRTENVTKKDFLYGSPFCHAPCMVRREAINKVGGYSESKWLMRVEDYHLWIKMYEVGYKGLNLNLPLYQMRDDRNAYQRRKFRYRINEAYVKILAIRKLDLSILGYVYVLKPLLTGILPKKIYDKLHRKRMNVNS